MPIQVSTVGDIVNLIPEIRQYATDLAGKNYDSLDVLLNTCLPNGKIVSDYFSVREINIHPNKIPYHIILNELELCVHSELTLNPVIEKTLLTCLLLRYISPQKAKKPVDKK